MFLKIFGIPDDEAKTVLKITYKVMKKITEDFSRALFLKGEGVPLFTGPVTFI